MAYNLDYDTIPGLVAGADLSSYQHYIVKLASTAGQVVLNATSVPLVPIGVLMNKPASGEAAEVAFGGVCKVIVATSTIAIGDGVGCNTTSKGTDAGTTDNLGRIGRALQASSAAGDIISVLLYPGGQRY